MPLTPPFNDGPSNEVDYRDADVISGSSLGDTNQFRQGIELRDEYYFMGSVKIHSGYPNHEIVQHEFGQSKVPLTDDNWFVDSDTYGPDSFIISDPDTEGSMRVSDPVYPKVKGNSHISFETSMDGVLEPLVIRAAIIFDDEENYYGSRRAKATLVDGNQDKDSSQDRIVSIYELNDGPNRSTYSDAADTLGSVVMPREFDPTPNVQTPWKDGRTYTGVLLSSKMDRDVLLALDQMEPTQENYVGMTQKSTTSGFSFDTMFGTDSLAFGGFYFVSSSVSLPPET